MPIPRTLRLAAVTLLCAALGACSSSSAGLSTASFLPGAKPAAAPDAGTERALHAAATSARAARCGYNFDPARLRNGYLTYESTQGGAADQLAKLEKSFDYTRNSIAAKIKDEADYCNDSQTDKIKADLTRMLAGDFAAPARRPDGGGDWWASESSSKKWNPQDTLFPTNRD